jgi:hypothetical protein
LSSCCFSGVERFSDVQIKSPVLVTGLIYLGFKRVIASA